MSQSAEVMQVEESAHQCFFCGWIYEAALGDPEGGIPPGTAWDKVPEEWCCPHCGAAKAEFGGVAD